MTYQKPNTDRGAKSSTESHDGDTEAVLICLQVIRQRASYISAELAPAEIDFDTIHCCLLKIFEEVYCAEMCLGYRPERGQVPPAPPTATKVST
jgi:hypothetical protein